MRFVVEFDLSGELAGKPLPSLNPMEAETVQMAVRHVQKALADGVADEAVVYVPVRVLKAARKIEVLDGNGRVVSADTPLEDLEGKTKPLADPLAVVQKLGDAVALTGK
jgi:hypothetical protein